MDRPGHSYKTTSNYIWHTQNCLGKGATAVVYQARHRTNGDTVAVKVFNTQLMYSRTLEREHEVLKKLKHENIVLFISVEEEPGTRFPVLAMEFCGGGSLYTLLEDPENAYGLEEQEFVIVVKDITAGMKYLRDQNVIHRDIKPGNIMRAIKKDGSSVYKLSDFGAARELGDEEQFMSLYGTEEYLHPDMYECAVLRGPRGGPRGQFGATVDLWSLGCTFYHVATGQLPFRPFGGRENKHDMHRMTKDKPPRAIAAFNEAVRGDVTYEFDLPMTCRLSQYMGKAVVAILQGLLDINSVRQWTFDQLFEAVQNFADKTVISVFNAQASEVLTLYMNPESTFDELQEALAKVTDIPAYSQQLFHDGTPLSRRAEDREKISEYPPSSQTSPFILVATSSAEDNMMYSTQQLPAFPTFSPRRVDPRRDYADARKYSGLLFLYARKTKQFALHARLLFAAAEMFSHHIRQDIEAINKIFESFLQLSEQHTAVVDTLQDAFFEAVHVFRGALKDDQLLVEEINRLDARLTSETDKTKELIEYRGRCDEHVRSLSNRVCERKELIKRWKPSANTIETRKVVEQMEQLALNSKVILKDLKKDKDKGRMGVNDEAIHQLNVKQMENDAAAALDLMQKNARPYIEKIFKFFRDWLGYAQKHYSKAKQLQKNVDWTVTKQQKLKDELKKTRAEFKRVLERMTEVARNTPTAAGAVGGPGPAQLDERSKRVVQDMCKDVSKMIGEQTEMARNAEQTRENIKRIGQMATELASSNRSGDSLSSVPDHST